MRRACFALSAVVLVTVHAKAAYPASPNAPAKNQASAAQKAGSAAPPAPADDGPPGGYYVEPSEPPPSAAPETPPAPPAPPGPPPAPPAGSDSLRIYEPPPPGFYPPGEPPFEPPPPPEPHHLAPRTALWLGARVGWFIPFGNLWSRGVSDGQSVTLKGVPWRDYASSGPMFELDAGARLTRNYNLFALWEHAQLGSGSGDPQSGIAGQAASGNTDFWGVGIRASSDPDRIGFVTELAIGYRRARSKWDDGTQIQLTDAPFEARLGLGADIRLNAFVTLSPMFSVGVGSFGKVERVANGTIADQTGSLDEADGHAWVSFTLGGHFDLLGSKR